MIELGRMNRLKVIRRTDHGFYLEGDEDWGDILLPNKYASEDLSLNDEIDVFIYFDSEDRIIATTLKPLAFVGEFSALEVKSIEKCGVFLDWGLEKDLFVPFQEQIFEMHKGKKYVIYVFVDNTERIAASTRLMRFADESMPPFAVGEEVELLICQETDLGFKAIVNGRHIGQIFKDDLIHNLNIADSVQGYVKNIRSDSKIDLSLRPEKEVSYEELTTLIVDKLKASGGSLDVNSKSSAKIINTVFKVSRKKFKIALGNLYKKKMIELTEMGIKLAQ